MNDLCCPAARYHILAVAGGALAVYDTRKPGKLRALSDEDDEELLAVALCKAGKQVVVGVRRGDLKLFDWGDFEHYSGRCAVCQLPLKGPSVLGVKRS